MRLISFEQHLKRFWSYIFIFQYFKVSHEFPWFPSFRFLGPKTKTRKSRKIFIFGSIMFKCMWIYFSISISTFSVLKQEKQQKAHWINLEGSDALKRQKYDTWIAMWLNHFEIDVIWTAFKGFLKLHSHISVFWGFSWISVISEFSFLGIGLKTKTRKSRKIFILQFFFSNFIKFAFVFVFLYFYWQNL